MAPAEVGTLLVEPHPHPDQKGRKRSHILQGQLEGSRDSGRKARVGVNIVVGGGVVSAVFHFIGVGGGGGPVCPLVGPRLTTGSASHCSRPMSTLLKSGRGQERIKQAANKSTCPRTRIAGGEGTRS